MAQKHKSKYKEPKDLEKSQKIKPRKDLKDYTMDDKKGGLNPKSNGDTIPNLLRKTDKPMVDDGSYDIKWNTDDRLYDDLENGEYDPKHALKRLKKREDKEEKEIADVIKDKKENLTRESVKDRIKKLTAEQKEALIKEYVRRNVQAILMREQEEEKPDTAAEVPEETPTAEPEIETPAETPASVTTEPAAQPVAKTEEPATPEEPAVEKEEEKQAKETVAVEKYVESLKGEAGNVARIKSIANVINLAMQDVEVVDQANFYKLLRTLAIKKLTTLAGSSEK
jgi:hypothetical protein